MGAEGLLLIVPDKPDEERDAVAAAWERSGGEVLRLGRFWDPPPLDASRVRVYGSDSFCLVLQQKLGLRLCSPDDGLLATVPERFAKRRIIRARLRDVDSVSFPTFAKTLVPKLVPSRVYGSSSELTAASEGLEATTEFFFSEVVRFASEVRAFVLGQDVLDCAAYEGIVTLDGAADFVRQLAREMLLPAALVVDVGFIEGAGWAVIEFNAAWGSGLNGCSADQVIPCIAAASDPSGGSGPPAQP